MPLANELVVIDKAGIMVMLRAFVPVSCGVLESAACTVKLNGLPVDVVGVPVIAPVAVFRESPGGNEPTVTDHVIGVAPPVEASVAL